MPELGAGLQTLWGCVDENFAAKKGLECEAGVISEGSVDCVD